VTLVLDAAALIALEQNETPMWVRLKAVHETRRSRSVTAVDGSDVVTVLGEQDHAGRGSPNQGRSGHRA
jgi:hypothetical protein